MSVRQNKRHKQTETERSKSYEIEKKTFYSGLFPGCSGYSPSGRMRGAGTGGTALKETGVLTLASIRKSRSNTTGMAKSPP